MSPKIKKEFPGITPYFDRHKKRRFRYRSKGFSAEIHGLYGSDEFRENYEAALNRKKSVEVGSARTKRGTVNALVVSYYKSPEFIGTRRKTPSFRAGI